jgi:hypothetical protein
MDSNLLAIVISAVVVLAVAVYAVFAWRRQPKLDTSTEVQPLGTEKQIVYQQLWNKIETLTTLLRRSQDFPIAEFRAHLAEIDRFIVQQALVVEQQDSEMARRYLDALRNYTEQVNPSGEARPREDFQETRKLPPDLMNKAGELSESAQALYQLRGELLARFHMVINAKS